MNIYHNTKNNSYYVTRQRNGSTLLSEISQISEHLLEVDRKDFLPIIVADKKIPIYIPIRDPMVRFKSGLTVQAYNALMPTNGSMYGSSQIEFLKRYKECLYYIDKLIVDAGSIIGMYSLRPYHLFDDHTEHWLHVPLLLCSYGFNVQLVPMYNWSEVLINNYPEAIINIKKRERKNSFGTSLEWHESYWDVYKSIFIDREPESYADKLKNSGLESSFDGWMDPEKEIFKTFMKHIGTDKLMYASNKLLTKFLATGQYFNDPVAPRLNDAYWMIRELYNLECHNELLEKVFLYPYNTIRDSFHKISHLKETFEWYTQKSRQLKRFS